MADHDPPHLGDGSTKPYLLRAIHEWAVDHQITPQLLVDAGAPGVVVPRNCVKDGRIVLTIHPNSVRNLDMGNEHLRFSARFAGKSFAVCIPVAAVTAIYCRENGRGIVFQEADGDGTTPPDPAHQPGQPDPATKPGASASPRLKLVK